MKLFCLGNSKEEKGHQLELITQAILRSQGYINVICNAVGSGGNEIDVSARFHQPLLADTIDYPVICECKAHKTPIDMDAWQKFIGKHAIASRNNDNTIGVMIALTGVKPTVLSDYESVKTKNSRKIFLYSEENIISTLQNNFNVEEESSIKELMEQELQRAVSNLSLICYKQHFIWYVELADHSYTLYSHSIIWSDEDIAMLQKLLKKEKIVEEQTFFNYWERERQQHELQLVQMQLIHLLSVRGRMPIDDVIDEINKQPSTIFPVSKILLVKSMEKFSFITDDGTQLSMKNDDEIDFVDFYRFVLLGGFPVDFFYSDYYQSHINDSLLRDILAIQANLNFAEYHFPKVLFLLKASPRALLYSLFPDKRIVTTRREDVVKLRIPNIDEIHNNLFIEGITRQFMLDYEFDMDDLGDLHKILGIDDVNYQTQLKIVKSDKTEYTYPASHSIFMVNIDSKGYESNV